MNLTNRKLLTLVSVLLGLMGQSCNDDPQPVKPGADGFFVVNEGGFGNSNTSISFYDRSTGQMVNDVFSAKNGRPLGDQTQSMTVFEGKGYVVVQGSGKIEVIDADDYSSIATIDDGLPSPRYFIGISATKGYVSDWGADGLTGTVKVIDLTSYAVIKTIGTGKGANRMLKAGNLVYVTNAGGFGKDNTVSIIDTGSDEITATIPVGDNPNSIQRDHAGIIWVASGGAIAYHTDWSVDEANSTKGSISKISNNTEEIRLAVDQLSFSGPGNLSISPDGKTIYYTYNEAVYSMSTSASLLPVTPFRSKAYYGLAVDPFNGNVIGCEAPNFSSAGSIDVMDATGNTILSYTVGIAPNGCAFK